MVNSLNAMVTLTRLAVRRGDEDAAIRVSELLSAATRTQEVQRILPAVVTAAEHAELIGTLPVLVPQLENLWQQTKDSELPWAVGEVAVWLRRAGCQPGATARTLPSSAAELAGDHAEAAQLWLALGCPFESSMVVVHAADPDLMVQGLAGLDELGAAATARWARLRLREHGVTRVPRGPRKETRANPAGLTSRQSAVLRLIAEQRTNAEIADELVVSVRTVDHHVAAILQKLNVENRKAAADKAREMGLI